MPSIDRADWHYGGNYPKGLPDKNGATHIGMFLAWAIHRGLDGELLREEFGQELERVRTRRMSGCEFLLSMLDEKLTDDCLSDEGYAFACAYYGAEVDSTPLTV
jgi:hypothetical protein